MCQINSAKVLENSIYWQRHVANNTRDPKQRERCLKAIERLERELKAATARG